MHQSCQLSGQEIMLLSNIIFICCYSIGFVQSFTVFKDVANFCAHNGLRFLTITSFETDAGDYIFQMFHATKSLNFRTRFVSPTNIEDSMKFHLDDFLVISSGPEMATEFDLALESIQSRKIQKSILLIPKFVNETLLIDKLQELNGDAFFYLAYQGSTKTKFMQVISLSDTKHTILSQIEFNQFGVIKEDYNLQGINIISYTLTWAPFFVVEDCNNIGQGCKSSGFYADYMNGLGTLFNFTWESYKDVDGNWGVTPINGMYNSSGIWGGVMGSIINGKYHLSLSQWVWNSARGQLLDFIGTTTDTVVVVMTPSPPEIDIGLFVRPFKNEAWIGVIVVIGTSFVIIMVPYAYLNSYENTDGYMIANTSIWFFFLLMNAYYGGAMTMFFTTEVTIPFETKEDVMRAYPSYNLMMQSGMDVYFNEKSLHVSLII